MEHKLFSFRNLRIILLLTLLLAAAIYTKSQRLESTSWLEPLDVSIFPVNGDDDPRTASYIRRLGQGDFSAVDDFTRVQGKRYRLLTGSPTRTRLGPEITERPPSPPDGGSNPIKNIYWSLRLRYWAWTNTPDDLSGKNRVRLFVLFHQPVDGQRLPHSLGLQKGLLGIVHAFADTEQNPQNNIIIAHELMHTVGATDKYGDEGEPLFPHGYAEPGKTPRYPQRRAEIMAVRIPVSAEESRMAASLASCTVGRWTAREINWLPDEI